MDNIITDGLGKGFAAGVTHNNRLKTTGVDLTLTEAATESGDTYNLNTSELTLTSGNETAVIYIKNNEDHDLIITGIILNIRDYTGTGGQPNLRIYRGPISGTLVTNAVIGEQSNRNYGSQKTLDVDLFEGVEGDTLTGETNQVLVYLATTAAVTFHAFDTIIDLPKGASVGLTYEPPAGTTSVKVVAAMNATLNGSQL